MGILHHALPPAFSHPPTLPFPLPTYHTTPLFETFGSGWAGTWFLFFSNGCRDKKQLGMDKDRQGQNIPTLPIVVSDRQTDRFSKWADDKTFEFCLTPSFLSLIFTSFALFLSI